MEYIFSHTQFVFVTLIHMRGTTNIPELEASLRKGEAGKSSFPNGLLIRRALLGSKKV